MTIQRLLTDNGSAFRSRAFAALCHELGIKHRFTRPYRPQTNGKAERFIQSALREWACAATAGVETRIFEHIGAVGLVLGVLVLALFGVEVVLQGPDQVLGAFAVEAGDREDRAGPAEFGAEALLGVLGVGHHVQLVEHQPAGLGGQLGIVAAQFFDDGVGIDDRLLDGIGFRVGAGDIDQVQQYARARQVAQEQVAQAGALGGAFDQAGNVRHHEAARGRGAHHAQVGVQRREGVVGDLGPRVRNAADQRRLAGIGQPEQADVGQHLELHAQAALFAFLAGRPLARRAIGAGLEMDVAHAAGAARGQRDLLVVPVQVEQHLAGIGVVHHGAHRHAQGDVGGRCPVLVRAAAVLAVLGAMQAGVAEVDQGVDIAVGHGIDAAAAPAVAAVRAALGDEFFAPKAGHAIAALAGDDFNGGFVYEFHDLWWLFGVCPPGGRMLRRGGAAVRFRLFCLKTKSPAACGRARRSGERAADYSAATTETVGLFRAPLTLKCTLPLARANRVWSLPTPTFTPG
ncbi:integrase core domain protein [Bordetella pertussis B200]|nr:integrase core domain protein [Bordetella pertussis B200]